MRRFTPVNKLALSLSWLVAVILVLLPLHAFLTVWLSSLVGHYTLLRLWKEFLLVPIALGAVYLLLKDRGLSRRYFHSWVIRLILIYSLLLVITAIIARLNHAVSSKAMWYGLLVDSRFLVFFLAVLVIASSSEWLALRWQKILLGPAILVAAFAILQYLVLPTDFLKHFGYSGSTISPYETINHNLHNLRVASTLRGANPLGAYLILPLCAMVIGVSLAKKRKLEASVLLGGLTLAIIFSFSRSAWIGVFIGALITFWIGVRSDKLKQRVLLALTGLVVLASLATVALHNNYSFRNILLHNDRTSSGVTSSNTGHATAFKDAARDIIRQPLGGGVGTAGPASAYNYRYSGRISENYFLQIGQEAGLLGAALFIAICAIMGKLLYERRADPLALVLFASLIGISLVNLLSHAWTDDTLAYVWWGLAGVALTTPATVSRKLKSGTRK